MLRVQHLVGEAAPEADRQKHEADQRHDFNLWADGLSAEPTSDRRFHSDGMQIDMCETSCNAAQLVSMGGICA